MGIIIAIIIVAILIVIISAIRIVRSTNGW